MSHTTSRSVGGDKLAVFLQQTLGTLAEGYVVSLAELSSLKEPRYQKELLSLKEELKAKDDEFAGLRKKLEKAEADLVLANTKVRESLEKNKRLPELEKQLQKIESELKAVIKKNAETKESLDFATTKIKDMEDGVSKLLSKVTIPSWMIEYMTIDTQYLGRIEEWGCREGGLIKPDHYDVIKVNSDWLGWGINGFLMSKLKKKGSNVLEDESIAKYVKLD